ncbi:hypothetical protein C0J52_03433 [Blattella germanica]|nr:hypothetical protein C0J52_03433 [Blattella germanica]
MAGKREAIMDEIEAQLQEMHRENQLEITEAAIEDENEEMHEEHLIEPLEEDDIPITYEVLRTYAEDIKLPSALWAVHKDPNKNRLPATRTGRLVADKSIVFVDSLVPCVFFREMKIKLPTAVENQPLQSLDEISEYIKKIHRLAFCSGTGLRDPIRSIKCRIYVDMPSTIRRCTACSAQRQSVLFAAQQKTS